MQKLWLVMSCMLLWCCTIQAQHTETDAPAQKGILNLPGKVITGLQDQYARLTATIEKQNEKLLLRMQAQEAKLRRKLKRKDSTLSAELFTEDITSRYTALTESAATKTSNRFPLKEYLPGADSLQTTLFFLQKNPLTDVSKLNDIKALQGEIQAVQGKLQQASDIQAFVREREALLKEKLSNTGLGKELLGMNKQVYYYQEQIANYKAILNDKEKLKNELISRVRNLPAFQSFWQRYSYIAQLFPQQPATTAAATVNNGLQTISGFQDMLAARVGNVANPAGFFQQQVSAGQEQLNSLRNRLSSGGTGNTSGEITQPDFKPNTEHNKKFIERIEYGVNLQHQRPRGFLPITSDIAVNAGYRFSNQLVAGVSLSYKMGWGSSIKELSFTHEGIGLRSYSDMKIEKVLPKIKSNIWLSGGIEYNYLSSFKSIRAVTASYDSWQRSALLGLTKKITIGSGKNSSGKNRELKMQLLYDFLWQQQQPMGEQLVFRTGYNF